MWGHATIRVDASPSFIFAHFFVVYLYLLLFVCLLSGVEWSGVARQMAAALAVGSNATQIASP
jgi:hypothetical protein